MGKSTNKTKPKKKSRFWRNFLFIILVAWAGYYVGSHRRQVKSTITKNFPQVKRFASRTLSRLTGKKYRHRRRLKSRKTDKKLLSNHTRDQKFTEIKKPAPLQVKELSATHEIPDNIKLGSFNIRMFSNKSRNDDELKYIASILRYHDVIAIQELKDERVLERTVNMLREMGYDYDYEISPQVGRDVREIYAFLYRKDKVKVKYRGKVYNEQQDVFIHKPFYATFQAGNFDFTLCNVRLLFNNDITQRRLKLSGLTKVYRYLQIENPQEKDIILLGDFNLPPTDRGWRTLKDLPSMAYLIKPPAKTTISDKNLYDNFWFQKRNVKEYTGQAGVVKFDENIFKNDDRQAKLVVSDHRPIWATFKTSLPDDD